MNIQTENTESLGDGARSPASGRPDYAPLWAWIREREAIRVRKEVEGRPSPWTADPILAQFRFCNVRREDDRVTRWVRDYVRVPYAQHPELWQMLCVCRVINWPDTLAELIAQAAWPGSWGWESRLADVLRTRRDRGDKVFTGAYVIPAGSEPGRDKASFVGDVMLGALSRLMLTSNDDWEGRSLASIHAAIKSCHGWGDFLAYQAVVDMTFCDSLLARAPDRQTWAAAGPGTLRGLHRLHGRPLTARVSQAQALDEIRAIYAVAEAQTGVVLDFSDVPNVLCETDKYLRVQNGEGKPRARYVPGRGC